MLDALPGQLLPGTTLPVYPGLGRSPNMLACIPGGLVQVVQVTRHFVSTCNSPNHAGADGGTFCRVPGDLDEVNSMKVCCDQWKLPTAASTDPYLLASLLKLWFRELCEPVIPRGMHSAAVVHCQDADACVALVDQLPQLNRLVLLYLIHFLQVRQPVSVSLGIQSKTLSTLHNDSIPETPSGKKLGGRQGRRHRLDWDGHVHPIFARGLPAIDANLVSFYSREGGVGCRSWFGDSVR